LGTAFAFNSLAQNKDSKSNSPKEDIKVNREYDEQGNLIKFDSTYTYNWSGDTTLVNSMSTEDLNRFFDDHFKFFNDSSFIGDSFFNDFNQLFSNPFSTRRDSVLMKKFGMDHFHSFNFNNDSLAVNFKNFDDFFGQMKPDKSDSISSKAPKVPFSAKHPRTMDDMMKMLQQQMQEMEGMQRKFLDAHQNSKNQPKLKEF
jgi:hypothetical protein